MNNYEIGSRIGDYEVIEVLGAGGMGRVYKVRNVISDRIEAMKVLLPNLEGDPDLADRFIREIKVQASLDHPNIAALHTALRVDNQLLMLMEYVEGRSLEQLLQAGPLPLTQAVDYMAQVLSALSYAHGRGIVHRDLKPANMMITGGGVVKLMDFGIARMTADQKLTKTGLTLGSLYYMSPEQIKGALDLDARSDLYSLGVSFYEIVTGVRPFQGDSEYSIMAAHLQQNPPPPIQVVPGLPEALSEIILMSLDKDREKRFQTADAFRNALLSVAKAQGFAAAPAPVPTPAQVAAPKTAAAAAGPAIQPAAAPVAPQAQAAAPKPAVAATQPAAPRSRRGLYMAIGALLAVAVLVVAATQLPKFRGASAKAPAASVPAASAAPVPATVTAPPAETQPVSNPAPAVETQPAAAVLASPAASVPSPAKGSTGKPQASPVSAVRQIPAPAPVGKSMPAPTPAVPQQVVQQAQAPAAQPVQPAAAAPDNAASPELERVREQLNLLDIRSAACKSSIASLRSAQARSGLGLRTDIAASEQRMDYYLNETEAALKRKDAAAAKKSLDSAEREVAKVETFLGK